MADTTVIPDILGIPSWEARGAWKLAGPLLAPSIALTKGAWEPEDVLKGIEAQEGQLWVACTDTEMLGAVVSNIIIYPRKRGLYCPFVGGTRLAEWWVPMFAKMEEFARARGCDRIEGAGRLGWTRKLPGMKSVGDLLMKEL